MGSQDFATILANVKWDLLWQVFAASIGFTAVTVILFSLGMRLLTNADHVKSKANKGKAKAVQTEVLNRSGAYMLFAMCALVLAYGIYWVVPAFHLAK